jgi:transcriptional regulator with XRE-family HTH domain
MVDGFGDRVRLRRRMLGISRTELARQLGVSFQQVQKYEKGRDRISPSRMQKIANFLQVPIPLFFESPLGYSDPSTPEVDGFSLAHVTNFLATSEGHSLTKAFSQIKDRKLRYCIVRLVEAITGENG